MPSHCEPLDVPEFDPLTLLTRRLPPGDWRQGGGGRFFWSSPDTGEAVAGLGSARRVRGRSLADVRQVVDGGVAPDASSDAEAGSGERPSPSGRPLWTGSDPVPHDVPAFVAVPFDVHPDRYAGAGDDPWDGMTDVSVIMPEVVVHRDARGARLTIVGTEARDRLAVRAGLIRAVLMEGEADDADPGGVVEVPERPGVRLTDDGRAALRDRVVAALEAIRRGEVDKVVVSVAHTVMPSRPPDPIRILRRLRARQPGTFIYLWQTGHRRALVGASPERLVAVHGATARTMALAGSARRDPDPEIDRALGEALLTSPKDRAEHAWVVDAIRVSLADVASRIDVRDEPRLRRLVSIQHLETPIEALLAAPGHLLDLAARLHPTPALGGSPRWAALDLIRRLEGTRRGLYGGAVGWLDGDGDGDLAVAIRCLLVHGDRVTAFAGAGIVAGSNPDAEVDEVELKLGAALSGV
jgi:isochorismate synthase